MNSRFGEAIDVTPKANDLKGETAPRRRPARFQRRTRSERG
jgi:hypothetical protein